jgi:hypothetical protein
MRVPECVRPKSLRDFVDQAGRFLLPALHSKKNRLPLKGEGGDSCSEFGRGNWIDSRLCRSPLWGALALLVRPKSLRDFVDQAGRFHLPALHSKKIASP